MGVVRENSCQLLGCLGKRLKLGFLWEAEPRGGRAMVLAVLTHPVVCSAACCPLRPVLGAE